MLMSHHKNAGQDHNIKTANRSSENVAKLKYLGMTATNRNLIHEEIKSPIEFGAMLATIQFGTFCLLICCLKT
jgi:hypothetical protein